MKVANIIKIYEVNGSETAPIQGPTLEVASHWSRKEMVTISLDGEVITVDAIQLQTAIQNATNWVR